MIKFNKGVVIRPNAEIKNKISVVTLNTNGSLGDNFTRKIEKIPTHQKFVEFCRRVSSNQELT
jgi:hypothetical protein